MVRILQFYSGEIYVGKVSFLVDFSFTRKVVVNFVPLKSFKRTSFGHNLRIIVSSLQLNTFVISPPITANKFMSDN